MKHEINHASNVSQVPIALLPLSTIQEDSFPDFITQVYLLHSENEHHRLCSAQNRRIPKTITSCPRQKFSIDAQHRGPGAFE
jgi:hypothetical protein